MQDHAIRMLELLGCPAHVDEVFQQTHIRKEIGQFVDDRSRRTHCWVVAAGGKQKGRIYGVGDLARGYKCGDNNFMQQTQASSSCSQDSEEMNQLRQRLSASEEEIRRMSCQFQSFIGAVLQYLPGLATAVAQNIFQQ
ncbi:mitochondrial import inner membrane translocase subunit TIM50 [Spatholobus suberectus]|nr:mitochondrial import inner membrane translocase subunit TIM50 [Spatholobus suberectus]